MLLQAVIGACLKTLEDFSIGPLDLSITLWMSNGCIADLDDKILTVSLNCTIGELGPVVSDDLFRTSYLQMIELMNLVVDCLLILAIGVAFGHLVNLLMATYRYWNPPTAPGNGPMMSSPHTANDLEDEIICSVCISVWMRLA
jgi:hypothetical protein